jgi:Rrf2 family transcriptional regulator, iron-sulfur cluster assembly transcription factor
MIYSNACAYAIRAMTRLAMLRPDGYVLRDELCEGSGLPKDFVAKIFQHLVREGLLISAKGRGGGFALARKPTKITLYDIVAAVDGVDNLDACVVGFAKCDDKQACPLHDQWAPMRNQIKEFLARTTLDKMSETTLKKLELTGEQLPVIKSPSKPMPPRD